MQNGGREENTIYTGMCTRRPEQKQCTTGGRAQQQKQAFLHGGSVRGVAGCRDRCMEAVYADMILHRVS